jgi:ATP-dependent protease ClpP protease subunit
VSDLYLFGDVTNESAEKLIRELHTAQAKTEEPIHLWINSLGGDLTPGLALYTALRASKSRVHGHVLGTAQSSASLVLCGCQHRSMGTESLLLIHQLSGSTEGTYESIRGEVKNCGMMMDRVLSIYRSRTAIPPNVMKGLMKARELITHSLNTPSIALVTLYKPFRRGLVKTLPGS